MRRRVTVSFALEIKQRFAATRSATGRVVRKPNCPPGQRTTLPTTEAACACMS